MINLMIEDIFEQKINPESIERAVYATLQDQSPDSEFDLSIVIDTDERIQELNNEYRGINAPTDVLSFSSEEIDPDTGNQYIGDIIISYPRAEQQALAAGHPVQNELQLLVVHGVLHLLGFDHSEEEEKQEMWSIQANILNKIGTHLNRLPEE